MRLFPLVTYNRQCGAFFVCFLIPNDAIPLQLLLYSSARLVDLVIFYLLSSRAATTARAKLAHSISRHVFADILFNECQLL